MSMRKSSHSDLGMLQESLHKKIISAKHKSLNQIIMQKRYSHLIYHQYQNQLLKKKTEQGKIKFSIAKFPSL